MSILAIGQSSFLASEVKKQVISKDWSFLSYKDAFDKSKWSSDVRTVICFACDPKVRVGEFSDFDYKLAKAAKESGAAYIMLSSRAVYGISPALTKSVETQETYENITPYGLAKKQIENDLLENFDNVAILRLSNIFGFEYGDDRTSFFGIMLKSLKESGVINLSMGVDTERDFLPVQVLAEYLSIVADNPKFGVYNVGAGIGTPVGDMARWVIEGYGSGSVADNDAPILDSFVLDMTKTRVTYALEDINAELIRTSCIDIGKSLRDS